MPHFNTEISSRLDLDFTEKRKKEKEDKENHKDFSLNSVGEILRTFRWRFYETRECNTQINENMWENGEILSSDSNNVNGEWGENNGYIKEWGSLKDSYLRSLDEQDLP